MSDIAKEIDRVIAASLAPCLKSQGFKKKSRDFYRIDEESVALVNVQASSSNLGADGAFTLNVCRYFPSIAEIQGNSISGQVPKEYDCTIRERIGMLRNKSDHWWKLSRGSDNSAIAEEVTRFVEAFAIPFLQQTISIAALRDWQHCLPPITAASLALVSGDSAGAARIAREFRDQRPFASAHVAVWARRNGVALD